jgi:hypothetical protein
LDVAGIRSVPKRWLRDILIDERLRFLFSPLLLGYLLHFRQKFTTNKKHFINNFGAQFSSKNDKRLLQRIFVAKSASCLLLQQLASKALFSFAKKQHS